VTIQNLLTAGQLEYVNDYCWIQNTYYLPHDRDINRNERRERIPYYQWVPFIFLAQALMFYAPCLLWQKINVHAGINVKNLVEAGHVFIATEMADLRQKTLSNMIGQMDRLLKLCGLS